MREIKFKFWLGHIKKMTYEHSLIEISHVHWDFTEDIIPLQFTGLKDKNNIDIYESDILYAGEPVKLSGSKPKNIINVPKGVPLKVFFHEGSFKFKHNARSLNHNLTGLSIRFHGLEVVGNVYEHAQLLGNQITNP